MAFKEALRARGLAAPAVAALIVDRLDWSMRADGTALPAVVLALVSDQRVQHLKGFVPRWESRVSVDCIAASGPEADAVREAMIAAFSPAASAGGITFGRGLIELVRDRVEASESGVLHQHSFDLVVFHD